MNGADKNKRQGNAMHRIIRLYTTGISLIEADPPQADRLIRLYLFVRN